MIDGSIVGVPTGILGVKTMAHAFPHVIFETSE